MSDWDEDINEEASRRVAGSIETLNGLLNAREWPFEFRRGEQRRDGFSAEVKRALPEGISVQDILEDIEDFAVLAALTERTGAPHLAVRFGDRYVALLPARGVMNTLARMDWPFWPTPFFDRFTQDWFRGGLYQSLELRLQERSWEQSKGDFLSGLSLFLIARVAGTQWLNRGGVSVQSARSSTPSLSSAGQWWTVETQASGLSAYCAGTHAARVPADYLAGVTSVSGASSQPHLPVFLPLGTMYLAGDAGPGGTLVWDDKTFVTVPSATPLFATKRF